jgi:hypothetical protein
LLAKEAKPQNFRSDRSEERGHSYKVNGLRRDSQKIAKELTIRLQSRYLVLGGVQAFFVAGTYSMAERLAAFP